MTRTKQETASASCCWHLIQSFKTGMNITGVHVVWCAYWWNEGVYSNETGENISRKRQWKLSEGIWVSKVLIITSTRQVSLVFFGKIEATDDDFNKGESRREQKVHSPEIQWASILLGLCHFLLLFRLCTPAPRTWNDTMTMGSKCRLTTLIWMYFRPYQANRPETTAPFVHSPPILGDQNHLLFILVGFQIILCPIEINDK